MSINPKEFLDTAEELHALVIGFCEVLCPWPAQLKALAQENIKELSTEPHYYHLGRGLGMIAWLGIIILLRRVLYG